MEGTVTISNIEEGCIEGSSVGRSEAGLGSFDKHDESHFAQPSSRRKTKPKDKMKFLSEVPEAADSIALRFDFFLFGSKAHLVKNGLCQSSVQPDVEAAAPSPARDKSLRLLCKVPQYTSEGSERMVCARLQVHTIAEWSDHVPTLRSAAEGFASAAVFVVQLPADGDSDNQTSEFGLDDQMSLLNTMAHAYYHPSNEHVACFGGLMLLGECGAEAQPLPASVEEFRQLYQLDVVFASSAADFVGQLATMAALIPERGAAKQREQSSPFSFEAERPDDKEPLKERIFASIQSYGHKLASVVSSPSSSRSSSRRSSRAVTPSRFEREESAQSSEPG